MTAFPLPSPDTPGLRVLSTNPVVYTVDAFATGEECAAICREAAPHLEPPRVSRMTLDHDPGVRTGRLAWLAWGTAPRSTAFGERVARLVGRTLDTAESLQVVRYQPGERYLAHYDAYDLTTAEGRHCARLHGQREITAIIYLGEPDAGGATAFPQLKLAVEPRLGRLLVFQDLGDDPRLPHGDALHAGTSVQSGIKWIASQWFCRRVAEP